MVGRVGCAEEIPDAASCLLEDAGGGPGVAGQAEDAFLQVLDESEGSAPTVVAEVEDEPAVPAEGLGPSEAGTGHGGDGSDNPAAAVAGVGVEGEGQVGADDGDCGEERGDNRFPEFLECSFYFLPDLLEQEARRIGQAERVVQDVAVAVVVLQVAGVLDMGIGAEEAPEVGSFKER